jgi:hypothetical protein
VRQTSNIADCGYMGTAPTLAYLGTSLKLRDNNPHATLITLYMNAVDESAMNHSGKQDTDQRAEYKRVAPYVFGEKGGANKISPFQRSPYIKEIILMGSSQAVGRDGDLHFDRYVYASPGLSWYSC